MSTFGSTTHKGNPKDDILPEVLKEPEVLTDKDADMKTLNELRGVAKDMKEGYENLHEAKLSLNEKATVEGVMVELQVVRQQLEMTHEQMKRLIGMYSTLQAQFDQYQQQRTKELNVRVNGGSTTPEDMDGDNT